MNDLRVPLPLLRHFHALRPVSKHGLFCFSASLKKGFDPESSSILAVYRYTAHLFWSPAHLRRSSPFSSASNFAAEVFSGCFRRKSTIFSSGFDVKCLSFGPQISTMTASMAIEAVCEDSSDGFCSQLPIEERVYDDWSRFGSTDKSSPAMAGAQSIAASQAYQAQAQQANAAQTAGVDDRQDTDEEGLSSRVDATFPRGAYPETLLKISEQFGPSTQDHLAEVSSMLSTEEGRCDCSASGAEIRKEDNSEGNEGFAKRLRTEERLISNPAANEFDRRIAVAWDHWRKLGEPKFHVAPMVDQSELPFRMLCRKYGATAAYTPMLHSRLFAQEPKYRSKEFTTCPDDRPLFVQFCANNPDTLLEAARLVEAHCDYVDINLGCPQRIAKKGNYGAFLMDNLPLIKSLVSNLASNLAVPVSCKIRVFPDLEDTLAYARMLEEAGCSLLAVHGRTRDQKNGKLIRADWEAIKAVKTALRIPVLANGNIRWLEDAYACIAYTGVDGVMSAESLLENPALYAGYRVAHTKEDVRTEEASGNIGEGRMEQQQTRKIDERVLMQEYLDLCEEYPVPMRMVRGHVHKILGNFWFKRNPDIREELNRQSTLTLEWLKDMLQRLMARPASCGSLPQDEVSDTQLAPQELTVVTSAVATSEVFPLHLPSQDVIIRVQ